jgi:hypothetical protein
MPEVVYILCAVTSAGCAVLLWRSYLANRTRLLLWSGLCFIGLALNNILLYVDLVATGPSIDLSLWRNASGLIAVSVLLGGLIWESK